MHRLFAMRQGHLGFGQTVHRRLELFAMIELRRDPEQVERALEEWYFCVETGQAHIPHRLQPDFVERRRQVIGPRSWAKLAKAVGKCQSSFTFGAKARYRVAQFLNFGETELVVADMRQQHFDTRVGRGGLDCVKDIPQGRLGADHQPQQPVLAGSLGEPLGQVDAQDDVVGKRGYSRF